jgi:hypothetical protein
MTARRRYTAELKAEAVGLAQSVGVTAAAKKLGIPHRTVSNWQRSPDMRAVVISSREAVAAKLWEAVVVGTDEVLAGLRDPEARLSDKARALEVVAQQHALLIGDVTARTQAVGNVWDPKYELTDEERRDLRDLLDTIQAEISTHEEAQATDGNPDEAVDVG